MSEATHPSNPFTSPFEAGMRALIVLVEAFPRALDLYRLTAFDYLTVHSGDADGPASLHAPVPLRTGELLVRSGLIRRGVTLMVSRRLVMQEYTADGFLYRATEEAGAFLDLLTAEYTILLKERAAWVIEHFVGLSNSQLRERTDSLFRNRTIEFETPRPPGVL